MKTTLPLIIALGLSSLAFGQGHTTGSTIEDAVALKPVVTKVNTGVELTAEETEIYNKAKESAANRRGPGGGGKGMQGGQGMQGGMQGGPQGMQGGMQGGPQGMQGGMQGGPQGMQGGMQGGQGMMQGPSAEKLQEIFSQADSNGDGKLDESEFQAACDALRSSRK